MGQNYGSNLLQQVPKNQAVYKTTETIKVKMGPAPALIIITFNTLFACPDQEPGEGKGGFNECRDFPDFLI